MPESIVEGQPFEMRAGASSIQAIVPNERVDGSGLELYKPENVWTFRMLRKVRFIPFWERVDDFGPVVRIAYGDSVKVVLSKEAGVGIFESMAVAHQAGLTGKAWILALERAVSRQYGTNVSLSAKTTVSLDRTFGNQDDRRRLRMLSLWRPGVRVEVLHLSKAWLPDLEDQEEYGFLYDDPAASSLWTVEGELSTYLPWHIDVAERYTDEPQH